MKKANKIIMLLAVSFMTVSCLSVSVDSKEPSGKMYSETISDEKFTEISASSLFDITLHKSDRYEVDIEVSEELKDVLVAEVDRKRLVLCFDDKDGLASRYKNLKVRADIYLPSFEKISLSGVSSIETTDTFNVDKAEFLISGASEIDDFYMIASDVKVKASGSSSMKADVYADVLSLRISGASDVELKQINNKVGKTLDINVSGASDIDVFELPYENVNVICSGASEVSAYPTKKMSGNMSGASDMVYKRNSKDVKIDVNASGKSSIREK